MRGCLPEEGDKVWYQPRHVKEGKQANGTITYVDTENDEVWVEFGDDTSDKFDSDMFVGMWTNRFGGCWYFPDDSGLTLR